MKIGITGGNGFIGSWIRRHLEPQHEILTLDHRRGDMLGDVRDEAIVHEFAAHVDGIIHLAAVLGTSETIDNPLPAAHINILGTLNVFEAAARYNLPIVYAAVGNSGIGRGTYCITKTTGEQFVDMYREDRGLNIISVRPMNAYGPGQSTPAPYGSSKVRKIVPTFICSALSGDPIPLYGGGTQYSDTVHVSDVAKVFATALFAARDGIVPNHPIDVGNSEPLRVIDVAEEIRKNIPGSTLKDLPMRPGEPHGGPLSTYDELSSLIETVLYLNPDLDWYKTERVLKYLGTVVAADTSTLDVIGIDPESFIPLDTGIKSTVEWYRENEGVTWSRGSRTATNQ